MIRATALLSALLLSTLSHAQEPDRVVMSLDQFLAMYEKSKAAAQTPPKPPAAYTRSSFRADGVVETHPDGTPRTIVFDAKVRIEPLQTEGWVTVPLIPADAALIEATLDGKPAPVRLDGGWYSLTTDRRTPMEVRLRFAVQIGENQGSSSFSLGWPSGSANELTITLPDDAPVELTVSSARRLQEKVVNGKRVFEASLASLDRLAVAWKADATQAADAAREARIYAEVSSLVSVGDGVLKATATAVHTILFAGEDHFRFTIPEDMTVLAVRGAGVSDWTLGTGGVLDVQLGYEAEGTHTLAIDMERVIGQADQTVHAPILAPLDVERAKGWVGVAVQGNLEVSVAKVEEASPVDIRSLPAQVLGITNQPVLLGYKYLSSAPGIDLQLKHHAEVDVLVTLIDLAYGTTLLTEDGRRLTQVRYEVRNNHKQYLRLQMPTGATLWSAAVAGKAIQPARGEDGAVLVPLPRSASEGAALSSFQVEVVYVEDGAAPEGKSMRVEADLPRVDVPVTVVQWTLYVPERAKVSKKADGSLRKVPWLDTASVARQDMVVYDEVEAVQQAAASDMGGNGMAPGASPVRVALPLTGQQVLFEKVLALDERLWVGIDLKGL
jgi:hypothetical protein